MSTESGVTMNGSPAELQTITRGEQKKVLRAGVIQQSSMWGSYDILHMATQPWKEKEPKLKRSLVTEI